MAPSAPAPGAVVWHDVECGGYGADLELWHDLAASTPGPILDVGAGTGRVALALAAAGHAVTALDRDPKLLAALAARAAARGLAVTTVAADACDFALDARFGLIVVPMQTIQLLPERGSFFTAARRQLAHGGLLALAIAAELESFEPADGFLPAPDVGEVDGWRFESQPTAVRVGAAVTRIERLRRMIDPTGARAAVEDVIELARLTAAQLAAEGRAAGFAAEPVRMIPATAEHVGSEVVLLRG